MSERDFIAVGIAVLAVSDTRTAADDRSGDTLVERLTAAGHRLAGRSSRTMASGRLSSMWRKRKGSSVAASSPEGSRFCGGRHGRTLVM